MTKNMGTIDRVARAFLIAPVAAIAALAFGAASIAGVVLLVVAGVMVATAAVGFLPALLARSRRAHRPRARRAPL
ncbi:MAG TPA: YgaP-like transmembrane domain [Gaiellaceae bacterium]|nr:YgaP-like transmembrane domain [Gaiellaceae bacterium]